MKNIFKYTLLFLTVLVFACQDEFKLDGTPPSEDDAIITVTVDDENDNIIHFSNSSDSFLKTWDLGNGGTGKGNAAKGIYPDSGTYVVKLTVYNAGGSYTSSTEVYIAQSDPTLLDKPIFNMLTGGADSENGKTWVIDSATARHFGLGPNTSFYPEWYAAGANEKAGGGMYDDRYTFKLAAYGYVQQTNGDVYINGGQASNFSGAVESPVGDFTAPFTAPDNLTWNLVENDDDYPVLTINNGGFIGYYTGVSTYQILKLEENEMFLRYLDNVNEFSWYIRLIPEGYVPGGGNGGGEEPVDVSLPIDFEEEVSFTTFGGCCYAIIDNPDANGINTSEKVAETVHGGDTWAGLYVELSEPIDFSSHNVFSIKVYAPQTGVFRLKFENAENDQDFVEIDQDVDVANEWVELKFDVSAVPSDRFAKIVVFPGWDISDAGTFYFDDLMLTTAPSELTIDDLTGSSAKIWKLKPAAGAFGVGPAKGSDAWWPNGANISGDRPCLFNDEFIFKSGGEYEYDTKGDIYAEAYMGLDEGCQDDANLVGTDAAAWGSGVHSFTFEPATESSPAFITITGTGAFIALPKAFNGGEYAAAPPDENASVTYEVLEYVKTGTAETLKITVDISGDGTSFWSFVLVAQ